MHNCASPIRNITSCNRSLDFGVKKNVIFYYPEHSSPKLVQGGLDPNKISGVGTDLGLIDYVLPGPNKQREAKPSTVLS